MIKECNFKQKVLLIGYDDKYSCRLMYISDTLDKDIAGNPECPGEDNCILYQIYDKLETMFMAKEHSKTMEGLARK